jgi:subtilisin family serine protease
MFSRRLTVGVFFIILSLLVVCSQPGFGQSAQAPSNAPQGPLPVAIDRGVLPSEERVFDSPEMLRRQSLTTPARTRERPGRGRARYLSGRVIVKFRGGMTAAVRSRALAALAPAVAEGRRPYADYESLRIGDDDDPEQFADQLRQRPDVEWAQADYRVYPRFIPNDPLYSQLQWNFPAIDLERAWDIQKGATSSIVVAVLDTGVAFRSVNLSYTAAAFRIDGLSYRALGNIVVPFARAPDLAAAGAAGDARFVAPRDFIWENTTPVDLEGHGTLVSGTIGELTDNGTGLAGVAFNVRLMPVKVLSGIWDDIFNSPVVATDDVVARGIRYAADNGAQVINMSLGRSGAAGSAPSVEDAIRYAVGRGCFVVVAGGNDFEQGNPTEVFAEVASRVQGAVSVAATDRSGRRAYYSSTGSWVELAAPGGSIQSGGERGLVYQQTYDPTFTDTYLLPPSQYTAPRFDVVAYVGGQGTSLSAPHVSGLAALLMQQGIRSPAAIEAALERFATDRGATGRDNETGFGEINARATLRGLGLAR